MSSGGLETTAGEFSSALLRQALGCFATGVTIVTTHDGEEGYGLTANAFSSVSLDPPLVLVCVSGGTEGAATIERNRCFAVNILRHDQEPYSRYFASRERPRGRDAFAQVSHSNGPSGAPILDGVAGYLDCRLAAAHEAGDHVVFIGEVLALGLDPEAKPLLFHRGRYCGVLET